jgi:8-oxo-dGTP diphosphatase
MLRKAVAIALFIDAHGRVLLTQRGINSSYPGWWEFPGGKVEVHETAAEALRREMQEELGVVVHEAEYLGQFNYDYPESAVCLWVYHVQQYAGLPRCCEQQQDLHWVTPSELPNYLLLEASRRITWLITNVTNNDASKIINKQPNECK